MLDHKGVARFFKLLNYIDTVLYKFIFGTKPEVIGLNDRCLHFNKNLIPFAYIACLLILFLERQTIFEPAQNTRIGITMCQFRY